ncbi:MAG: hypothetical protein GY906_26270, partial [bacterium]|nr:hypothetical protein [bacterium]
MNQPERASELALTTLFGELEGASDALIVGYPTLAEWGFGLERDDDGIVWVELRSLGLRVPSETQQQQVSEPACRTVECECKLVPKDRVYLEGPVVANLPVALEGQATSDLWVRGTGVTGVRVVEGPIEQVLPTGASDGAVVVTVEPGSRCLVCVDRCPWMVGPATKGDREAARLART